MHAGKAQSGTSHETDSYRERMAHEAEQVLQGGGSMNTLSATHLNGTELCTEVIVRKRTDPTQHIAIDSFNRTSEAAVVALRNGDGYHKKQSDHAGGNTCAAVIAASLALNN